MCVCGCGVCVCVDVCVEGCVSGCGGVGGFVCRCGWVGGCGCVRACVRVIRQLRGDEEYSSGPVTNSGSLEKGAGKRPVLGVCQ